MSMDEKYLEGKSKKEIYKEFLGSLQILLGVNSNGEEIPENNKVFYRFPKLDLYSDLRCLDTEKD